MKKTEVKKSDNAKLNEAIEHLAIALKHEKEAVKNPIFYAAIVKSFEVCFEYAWRHMKLKAAAEGLEIYSPREAIKAAGRIGLINDVETWLDDLENRNLSVHDYLGITKEDYLKSIKKFLLRVKNLK